MPSLACYQCLAPVPYEAGQAVAECPNCRARLTLAPHKFPSLPLLPGPPIGASHCLMHLRFAGPRHALARRLRALALLRGADPHEVVFAVLERGLATMDEATLARIPRRRPGPKPRTPGSSP